MKLHNQSMKHLKKITGAVAGALLLGAATLGQDIPADRVTVPLRDPTRPALVKANLMSGGITVKGSDGKEVIVDARLRQHRSKGDDDKKPQKKANGLKQ